MNNETRIQCPDCGNQIDVNDILKHQIEDGLRKEFLKEKNELLKTQNEKEVALVKAKEEFERAYLMHHLETVSGNVSQLAKKVGLERTHLYRKLKSLDINARDAK